MLKAVTFAPGKMEVREAEEPRPGPGEALVKVEAVGLCGSDFHLFLGDHPYARFPQTQGHEFAGVIEEFGPGYDGPLGAGQRVAVEPLLPCGSCFACRRGRYNCCAQLRVMGAHAPGALAEKVVVPTTALFPVTGLDPVTAALVEPVSIGLQTVVRAEVTNGPLGADDTVVVLGAGPIGQAVVLGAADRGARVLVADRIGHRLEIARHLGAVRTVDTSGEDLGEAVAAWTDGEGTAVVVDATGVPALVRLAFDLVAPSGTIVVVGISQQEVAIPVSEFSRKEVNLLGSRNNAGIFGDAVGLVTRNAERVRRLVTHRFGLREVPDAIDYAMTHPQEAEKVVVEIGEQS
jgi:L-gulonate 5-dehydrogenase